MKAFSFLKRFGLEPFVLCLFGMIFLAWLDPEIGISEIWGLSLGDLANWGVSVIFFFYGLRLNREKLASGLKNIKLHAVVQFSTFVVFPILVLCSMFLCGFDAQKTNSSSYYLWIGMFFLATLPSTVSSSVVMVSIARGNLTAAIFNASLSSLAGVFITPVWMSLFLGSVDDSHELSEVILKLVIQVIVPVCAGVALNVKFGAFAEKHKSTLRKFDESIILLIVYTSFCDSFHKDMFSDFPASDLILLSAASVALFFAAYGLIYAECKILKFSTEDTITALFCGSKKSLVHGSVMSKVLFSNPATIGVILLPTMLYHAYQLIIVSVIAKKFGKRS